MNGVRSTFMRRGYLLTALAALLLLAASVGTAEAQRVTIGFVETSGTVSENAYLNRDALLEPAMVTVQVQGLAGGAGRAGDITRQFGTESITITPSRNVAMALVGAGGNLVSPPDTASTTALLIPPGSFTDSDEVVLLVSQSADGTGDDNWLHERIELKLRIDPMAPASVGPDVYTLMVEDSQVAPVAKFNVPSFTLTEDSERRDVMLDIVDGATGLAARVPGAARDTTTTDNRNGEKVNIRVSNHELVVLGSCPLPTDRVNYNRKAVSIALGTLGEDWATANTQDNFDRTGVLQTELTIAQLAGADTADLTIKACGDMTGYTNPQITLTILERTLRDTPQARGGFRGDISAGSPLVVTVESDEAAPTLSFSPTDVTIDEGDSVSTRLIADGQLANTVGMVKLMVEGDAMVDLYHEDTMLEEMDGYVMVDMGNSNSARLTAMSMESRELQDGDMAYKAWKLVDGSTDAMIGDDSWFRVDVRGSTAVPALPLIGQLLLALFLMAGGSKLYRRRRG